MGLVLTEVTRDADPPGAVALGGTRRRPRLAGGVSGCRLISTESLTDVCSGGLRWSWAPRLLFVWALHIINQLYQKKKPAWNFGRAYTRARTR